MKKKLLFLLIFVAYVITGKLGLQFASVNESATAIWVPTGIALALCLLFGKRFWPAIFLGAFVTNITTTGDPVSSLGIAVGNTLEAVIGAYLISMFAEGKNAFLRVQTIFRYALLVIFLITPISANIGFLSLVLTGHAAWNEFLRIWFTWWLGDISGALIVTPFILFWTARHKLFFQQQKKTKELILASLFLIFISLVLFNGTVKEPLSFLILLPLIWIAFRFGRRETTSAIIFLTLIGLWGTYHGHGPFIRPTLNGSLLFLQVYMDIITLTVLTLAVAVVARREAEANLIKEKAEAEALLASIGDSIIATDSSGRIILVNNAFEEQFGWKKKEIVGKLVKDVISIHLENGKPIKEEERPLLRALGTGKYIQATHYLSKKNGQKFISLVTATPIMAKQEIIGAVEIIRDITKEKELDHAKDEFISLSSHELRTPLAAIRGLSTMLIDGDYGKLPPKVKKPLVNIHDASNIQIQLINDLLDVSRIQTGKISFELSEFSLEQPLSEVLKSLHNFAKESGIGIHVKPIPKNLVQADQKWVKQVLDNLINNAIKFTQKGDIIISATVDDRSVRIFVKDHGVGMEKGEQGRLFEKFRQLSSNVFTRKVGSGLGLFISRTVAQKMGGDVELVESSKEKGSTFVFRLPKAGTAKAQQVKEALSENQTLANTEIKN